MAWQDMFKPIDPQEQFAKDQETFTREHAIQNAKAMALTIAGASLAKRINEMLPHPSSGFRSATKNINPLTSQMLDKYLNQEPISEGMLADLAEAVEGSDTFAAVEKTILKGIRTAAVRNAKWAPDESHIEAAVREIVQREYSKGVYFTEGDHDLQSVIGGAHLEVGAVSIENGLYAVALKVSDSYDFSNNRKSSPVYDKFRSRLADLLIARDYIGFNKAWQEALINPAKSGLGPPTVFASYLFAIEKVGWLKGLPWSVIVAIADEAPAAARPSARKSPNSATSKKLQKAKG